MAFTVQDLASELGIDVSTLKPEGVNKWNGYLTEADTKYSQATAAQREAKEALEEAKRDQSAIDEQIQKFGVTEARLAEVEAANAAYKAALETARASGLNIDLSGIRTPAKVDPVDPTKQLEQTLRSGFAQMGDALRVQTRYQAVYGKPFVDDPVKLVDEAMAARMSVSDYAEQKYKFSAETEKQRQAEVQAKIDAGVQAGVKKYQEDHPVTAGHPSLRGGVPSQFSKVYKPRNEQEKTDFRRMSPRDRIASSVSRVREALSSNSD